MNKNSDNYVIIMAGGVGSRFWPVSRVAYPKQFHDILGIGKSLLQQTYDRFLTHFEKENIFIVTNESYRAKVQEQILDIDNSRIIGEPRARNTAACVAYASFRIAQLNPKANCIVAPSDHLVMDEDKFFKSIEVGLNFTEQNDSLVTLGIRPNRPDTGYGYIQFIEEDHKDVHKVKTFTEKPSLEIAETFIASGDFLWNSGIFIWNVGAISEAFQIHLPEIYTLFDRLKKHYYQPEEAQEVSKVYELCKNTSIDYGVMEKADNVYVIPAEFGWSDLGTWNSLYEIHGKDKQGNAINGNKVMLYDTDNCMISMPDEKLLVIKDVKNLIVVDTDDVLLICNKSKEQEVRQIVTDIKLEYKEKYT